MAVRKYHCIFCVSSPASRYTCFPARCWSLGCPGGDNLTRIASWRTRRMARRKRNVSDLPYAAPPLSCAAFFVKVQNGFAAASAAERKRGREKASRRRCGLFLCLKGEDSHHQFCLQPFPNVVVYTKMSRGEMTRFILKNRIESPQDLKSFQWEGFEFNERLSDDRKLIFTNGVME